MNIFFFIAALVVGGVAQDFTQRTPVDTSILMLENSPQYNGHIAQVAHKELEKSLEDGSFTLKEYYYLIFRYRDSTFIPIWQDIIKENPQNDLLKVWFINAVSQMEEKSLLRYIKPYTQSAHDLVRECAYNGYGHLGSSDDIPFLQEALKSERNGYVAETIQSVLRCIGHGGYYSTFEYLPRLYSDAPQKIRFFYNRAVESSDKFRAWDDDTSQVAYPVSEELIFPTQQFYYRIKYAPQTGTFGNNLGLVPHVGYDGAWAFEGLPVHSISNGVVRSVGHDLSWGSLVTIESKLPTGETITIIYGHLSRFLNVRPGEIVKMGQRIGQVGNSVSYENGGYWAHVHLGIARGHYQDVSIVGYTPESSDFYDPIALIKKWEK